MKAAIYCRLSEEDKEKSGSDSGSIRNQKTMLLQYAAAQDWEIYDIYSDDDYAGTDRGRPAFNRLLQDAKARRFDIVLCKTQSRFTREMELVEKYIHGLFPAWGIRFVSIVDHADTENQGNKKARQINGLVNEWYLEDMSENIRSVLTSRRQNGLHIGAFALYGYRKDPEHKGHLLIDEPAAAVVRQIFIWFSEGYGKTAIAKMLNDQGIPNPSAYKRQQGLQYHAPGQGTLWRYATISAMLANEMYIGNLVQGRYGSISYKTKQNRPRPKSEWYITKGAHEPIINRALWDKVQSRLSQRSKPFASGKIGLFAGKVRCAGCGYVMRSSKSHDRQYLRCPSRMVSKTACAGALIAVQRLEQLVLAQMQQLCSELLDKDMIYRSGHKEQEQCLALRASCEKQLAERQQALRALYLDRAKGLLTADDAAALAKGFAAEKNRLEQQMQAIDAQLAAFTEEIQPAPFPQQLSRKMVETFIAHIFVGKRIAGSQDIPIEIHWDF